MMRRGLYFLLMWVMVLRGLTGTAMAAGMTPPMQPVTAMPAAQHPPVNEHRHGDALQTTAALSSMQGDHHHGISGSGAATDSAQVHAAAGAAAVVVASPCDDASSACADHGHQPGSCEACDACEICHLAMLEAPAAWAPSRRSAGQRLPVAPVRFRSAPAALVIKPPIA